MALYQALVSWILYHLRNVAYQLKLQRLLRQREINTWCKLVSNVPQNAAILTLKNTWRMNSKGTPLHKNGFVYNPVPPVLEIELDYIDRTKKVLQQIYQFFRDIIPSALPYLLFLALYGLNERLGILFRFQDVNQPGFYVYNVSAIERSVLHFSPHKLISSMQLRVCDFLAAVPYLLHYVLPILYPTYLVVRGMVDDVKRFYWLLGWVLWVQYVIWWVFPTAPQWFYDNMDLYEQTSAPPPELQHKEGCAFHRIDLMTGGKFFFKLFNGNPVPFGAFPSGHVIWPFCIFTINPPLGRWFLIYVTWVAWATLYSCHHYLSDALGAVLVVLLVRKVICFIQNKLSQIKEESFCNRYSCLKVVSTNACPYSIV